MPFIRRLVKGTRLEPDEYDGNGDSIARLTPAILTIAGGILTIPSVGVYPAPGVYRVMPQSGTFDDLVQIDGGLGQEELVTLRVAAVGYVITLIHTPPNLRLATTTFVLNSIYDHIALRSYSATVWAEETRNSIPP